MIYVPSVLALGLPAEPEAKNETRSSAVEGVMSIPFLDNAALMSAASRRPSQFLSNSWNVSHNSRSWSHRKRLSRRSGHDKYTIDWLTIDVMDRQENFAVGRRG